MKIDNRPTQWIGALLIVAWMGFLALGVPRIAAAIPNETETVAGQPASLGGVTLTPEAGWTQPADSKAILILRKDGAQITTLPAQPAAGDAASVLKPVLDVQRNDASTSWQISEPQPFTTASGATGAWALALAPQQFVANFAVVENGKSALVLVSGTDTAWSTLKDEILTMVSTLKLEEAGS
jgi:Tfp pilus assembly protein PilW